MFINLTLLQPPIESTGFLAGLHRFLRCDGGVHHDGTGKETRCWTLDGTQVTVLEQDGLEDDDTEDSIQKLGKKIGVAPSQCLPVDKNPFADWCTHLFAAQRVQYVILTNTRSLYSMVMFGQGITDHSEFLKRALSAMREFMTADGYEFIMAFDRFIAPRTGEVNFSTVGDRRVLGSIDDLVRQAQFYLAKGQLSPFDASFRLNEAPMSLLGYSNPREALRALAVEHEEGGNGRLRSVGE